MPGVPYLSSTQRNINDKLGERVSVLDFGAKGDGVTDDSGAFNLAIQAVLAKSGPGGGTVYVPGPATYLLSHYVDFPVSSVPICLEGDGRATTLKRGADIAVDHGLLDVKGSYVTLRNFLADGAKTVSVPLQYYVDFNGVGGMDPMAAVLVKNSTVWVHGAVAYPTMDNVTIQHTDGYAVLLDARLGDITDVEILGCNFENNRPHTFGETLGDLGYGSWTGGIMAHGDGRPGAPFMVRRMRVKGCTFLRDTGNCIWQHLYGYSSLHESIQITDNYFLDIGLDCIQYGGVIGGTCSGNNIRRVGYVCADDTSQSVPKFLAGKSASGIDTSGVVMGVNYVNNTITSANGDCINADGFGHGLIAGNICRNPRSTDPEYVEDQIGLAGWGLSSVAGGPNWSSGINFNNTAQLQGGENVTIINNTLVNLSGGAILAYCVRGGYIASNSIEHPAVPSRVPIQLGNIGTADTNRAYGNVVAYNMIRWNPSSPVPLVFEDSTYGAFQPGDMNWVYDNMAMPVPPVGLAYEFKSDAGTASTTRSSSFSNLTATDRASATYVQREGKAADYSSALRWYHTENAESDQLAMQLQGYRTAAVREPLVNVSANGASGTGVMATGDYTQSAFGNAMLTGKSVVDGFLAIGTRGFLDTEADLLDGGWGLLHYTGTEILQSVAVSGGHRVWKAIGGSGGGVSGLTATRVPFAASGSLLIDSPDFVWDNVGKVLSPKLLLVPGATGVAGISLTNGFFQSSSVNGGFVAPAATGANAIQAPNGGVLAKWLVSTSNLTMAANATANDPVAASGQLRLIADKATGCALLSENGAAYTRIAVPVAPLTAGCVPFAGGAASLLDSADFSWNDSTKTLNLKNLVVFGTASAAGIFLASGFFQSSDVAGGFAAPAATGTNAIQAPNGGVTGKWLIATDSMFLVEKTAPALSASGQARFYMDSSTHKVRVSQNASPYVDLVGGGVSGLTAGRVPYASSSTALSDSAHLAWSDTDQKLTLTGNPGQQGLYLPSGYVFSHEGFSTDGANTDIIQALSGGITGKWLIGTDSLILIEEVAPALSASGQARIYADSTAHTVMISQNGSAYAAIQGLSGLTSGRIPYATGASSLSDTANLLWTNATKLLTLGGSQLINVGASGSNGLVIQGAASQSADLLMLKDNSGTALSWFGSDGILHVTRSSAAASSSVWGTYGCDGIQLKQTVGDESSCGRIIYRGFGAAALTIVGCGTAGGSRQVLLYDIAIASNQMWVNRTTDDASGAVLQVAGYVNASTGYAVPDALTNTDAFKTIGGGVTAKFLIGKASLSLQGVSQASAGLSNTGELRIICDNGNGYNAYISVNGGAYTPLSGSGGSGLGYSGLAGGEIPFTNSSSSVTGSSNLQWDNTNKVLSIYGVAASCLNLSNTGVQAPWLVVPNGLAASYYLAYILLSQTSPAAASGFGMFYYGSDNKFHYSENGATAVQAFGGASAGPYSTITSITVVNGRVTAISGS